MTRPLSHRDHEVLEYIRAYITEQGFPPTVREIGSGVGMSSPSTVQGHIVQLCDLGLLERTHNGSPRALRIIEQPEATL